MDEQIILQKISLLGEERNKVIKKIHKRVNAWGLKLPIVEPDPLHFGYNDFSNIGETEFNINNNIAEGYCGKFMFLFSGQTCPLHHHRVKHETFFIVKGKVEMVMDKKKYILSQGDTLIVPQFQKHEFTALEDSLILESSKPDLVDDSIFEDQRINMIIFGKEEY